MATGRKHQGAEAPTLLLFYFLPMLLIGCTDQRTPEGANLNMLSLPPTNILARSAFQYQGEATNATQLAVKGNMLYMTGTPFGFAGNDISEGSSPVGLFAVSEEITNLQAAWRPDWYAEGALAVSGQVGIMSGTAGASVINFTEAQNPVETARFPGVNPDSDTYTRDFGYVYKAIVFSPSGSTVYGLAQSDYLYTATFDGTNLNLITKTPYSAAGAGSCIVGGAAIFEGNLWVACRSALWVYGINSDGSLYGPAVVSTLQATNVVATPNHLYVAHDPSYGQTGGLPYARGIYAFNSAGNEAGFFPFTTNPMAFAVSEQDSFLYTNEDGNRVLIYQITLTQ